MPDPTASKRADARRNQQALLDAAAAVFVASGVNAPVRDVAAKAGVGMGTIYRHFPTRADLIVAVFRHQVEALAESAAPLLESAESPFAALTEWIDGFVDFLVTKHGLPEAMLSGEGQSLHDYFLDRLVPVCGKLLDAARAAGEVRDDVRPLELLRGVGSLCYGASDRRVYDARRMVAVLLAGMRSQGYSAPK